MAHLVDRSPLRTPSRKPRTEIIRGPFESSRRGDIFDAFAFTGDDSSPPRKPKSAEPKKKLSAIPVSSFYSNPSPSYASERAVRQTLAAQQQQPRVRTSERKNPSILTDSPGTLPLSFTSSSPQSAKTPSSRAKPVSDVVKLDETPSSPVISPYFETPLSPVPTQSTRHSARLERKQVVAIQDEDSLGIDGDAGTVFCRYKNVTITRGDIYRLRPGEYLNDSLIEGYLLYLRNKYENDVKDFFFFNSFFFRKLSAKGYQAVSKWTGDTDIFSKRYIVIPIHENVHWSLMIVANADLLVPLAERTLSQDDVVRRPVLLFLDSLGNDGTQMATKIRDYLFAELLAKKPIGVEQESDTAEHTALAKFWPRNLKRIKANVPSQENGCDCGVYLLEYVEQFIKMVKDKPELATRTFTEKDFSYWKFTSADADQRRMKIRHVFTIERKGQAAEASSTPLAAAADDDDDDALTIISGPSSGLRPSRALAVPPEGAEDRSAAPRDTESPLIGVADVAAGSALRRFGLTAASEGEEDAVEPFSPIVATPPSQDSGAMEDLGPGNAHDVVAETPECSTQESVRPRAGHQRHKRELPAAAESPRKLLRMTGNAMMDSMEEADVAPDSADASVQIIDSRIPPHTDAWQADDSAAEIVATSASPARAKSGFALDLSDVRSIPGSVKKYIRAPAAAPGAAALSSPPGPIGALAKSMTTALRNARMFLFSGSATTSSAAPRTERAGARNDRSAVAQVVSSGSEGDSSEESGPEHTDVTPSEKKRRKLRRSKQRSRQGT